MERTLVLDVWLPAFGARSHAIKGREVRVRARDGVMDGWRGVHEVTRQAVAPCAGWKRLR